MSRAVPSKLTAYGAQPIAVSAKKMDLTYTTLLPTNNAGSGFKFSPAGTNRILFRVPAYADTFLDCERSYLSFKFECTSSTETGANGLMLNPRLGTASVFNRMVVKSAGGLVIEDIQNLDILNRILRSVGPADECRHAEGEFLDLHQNQIDATMKEALKDSYKTGVVLKYVFRTGLLAQHLKMYLPLGAMNAGNAGEAFSVELYVNDQKRVLQKLGTGTASGDATKSFSISDVQWNMALLRADSAIADRFNSTNPEIVIPITTYRNSQNSISADQTTVQIAEACSDLRRIHTALVDSNDETAVSDSDYPKGLALKAGFKDSTFYVTSYQLQVGNKYLYNQPLEAVTDNTLMLEQVKNSAFTKRPILAEKITELGVDMRPDYETDQFTLTSSFCYTDPSQMTNGISLGSLPLTMQIKTSATPTGTTLQSFAECGYNLVIKDGYMSLKDSKDPSDFGMY
jgi:hypothetical protein